MNLGQIMAQLVSLVATGAIAFVGLALLVQLIARWF